MMSEELRFQGMSEFSLYFFSLVIKFGEALPPYDTPKKKCIYCEHQSHQLGFFFLSYSLAASLSLKKHFSHMSLLLNQPSKLLCFRRKSVLVRSSPLLSNGLSSSLRQTPPCTIIDAVPCGADLGKLVISNANAVRYTYLEKKVPLELVDNPMLTIGSSHGWIATLSQDDGILRLQDDLNPVASDIEPKRIPLPPLVTLPHCQTQYKNVELDDFITRGITLIYTKLAITGECDEAGDGGCGEDGADDGVAWECDDVAVVSEPDIPNGEGAKVEGWSPEVSISDGEETGTEVEETD
ncbi:uncharacterized protein LOC110225937 [Arabidopsis lyrata subsp. lyrata]|uniref:uncharacterized protein LOC110225937 n=1 Tax=Arabidopsis lyrata subsp. lyrata TaxID=81972 RepID=UPI000A29B804|nr:uncharacterized protein LOC110225937 [Arabidopsis lyrata subsp. lyrata]|eukprot:XP_020872004.1 uncharacterized protein LOC110225937 [Arabidopsis lyrata subsp. lyrata]